jgi:hypothetical protein
MVQTLRRQRSGTKNTDESRDANRRLGSAVGYMFLIVLLRIHTPANYRAI